MGVKVNITAKQWPNKGGLYMRNEAEGVDKVVDLMNRLQFGVSEIAKKINERSERPMDGINKMLNKLNREDGLDDELDDDMTEDQLLDFAKPCPFHKVGEKCEAVEIESVQGASFPEFRVVYDCTATGPLRGTEAEAVKSANRRSW